MITSDSLTIPHHDKLLQWKGPLVTALLCLPALVVFYIPGMQDWLQYDRAAIRAGQVWRLLTGHWTHWSGDHLFWDLGTFACLLVWCQARGMKGLVWKNLLASIAISAGLWLVQPDMILYRGLSGLDCFLYSLLAIDYCFERNPLLHAAGIIALVALILKVSYEILSGHFLFVGSMPQTPIPEAHLFGALMAGALGRIPIKMQFRKWQLRQ
ncbi:MAG: rhombosortase, partial [Candidatus Sumerlaeia bacterium]